MRSPAFQFYVDDFIGGTSDMTACEVGVYIRLLCLQWSRGGLPDDMQRLCLIARTNNEPLNEAAVRYVVQAKFKKGEDGLLRQARMEQVRKEKEKWIEKSAFGGKSSGEKRKGDSEWGKRMAYKRTNNEPPNEPTTNSPSPSPSPSPVSNTDTNINHIQGAKAPSRFVQPTPEQVTSYSLSIGYPLDGDAWCDSYAAKGWKVGKSPMKDWKAAVRNWKRNNWVPGDKTEAAKASSRAQYLAESKAQGFDNPI